MIFVHQVNTDSVWKLTKLVYLFRTKKWSWCYCRRDLWYQPSWLWQLRGTPQFHQVQFSLRILMIIIFNWCFSRENIEKTENHVGVSINDCRIFFDGSRVQEKRYFEYCQAKPKPQLRVAEITLVLIYPATQRHHWLYLMILFQKEVSGLWNWLWFWARARGTCSS